MSRNKGLASLSAFLTLLGVVGTEPVALSQESSKPIPEIEVKLAPEKNTIRVGEALNVRVEIWNVGTKELFIPKNIYNPCIGSPLSFRLEGGPPLIPHEGGACAADCMDDPSMSFTNRLVRDWVSLPAGHFYGTTVRMEPGFFTELFTPGHWHLRGSYRWDASLSSSFCMNHITLDQAEVEKLPYKGWKGREETNAVWIEVLRPHKSSPGKMEKP